MCNTLKSNNYNIYNVIFYNDDFYYKKKKKKKKNIYIYIFVI